MDAVIRFAFGDKWSDFWQTRGEKLYDRIHNGESGAIGVLTSMDAVIRFIFGDKWSDFWQEKGALISEKLEGAGEAGYNALQWMNDRIRYVFGENWVSFWEGVGEAVYDALNPKTELLSAKGIRVHVGGGAHRLAKFATGGIVTRPTNALIGESGSEAVIPLENNTGWIEKLAARINSGGGGTGSITLNTYLYPGSKAFHREIISAEQIEKARRGG